MKYIKIYENFSQTLEINTFCNKFGIKNYTINPDFSIDVDGDVDISPYLDNVKLFKIPIKFNKVTGFFSCTENALTSLENCPNWVGLSFNCSHNKLTSLEHCPKYVETYFYCTYNQINTLEYLPEYVGEEFNCSDNKIKIVPTELYNIVIDEIVVSSNPITDLKPTNIDIQYWSTPFDDFIHYLVTKLSQAIYTIDNLENYNFRTIAPRLIDILDEFDVIKDNYKIDLISLNSVFDFYKVEFNEGYISNQIKRIEGYEIY